MYCIDEDGGELGGCLILHGAGWWTYEWWKLVASPVVFTMSYTMSIVAADKNGWELNALTDLLQIKFRTRKR